MRVFALLLGAGIAVGTLAYRLLTAPARKRLAKSKPKWSEIVVTKDNVSWLYVVLRRTYNNLKRRNDLSSVESYHMNEFIRVLEGYIRELERGSLSEYAQLCLRYEASVWRTTWFEITAQSKIKTKYPEQRVIMHLR